MSSIIEQILKMKGNYIGKGINHDNQEFVGDLEIKSLLEDKAVGLKFIATGRDGQIYHQEETTIALDDDGGTSLWTINSNAPMLYRHKYINSENKRNAQETLLFRYNDVTDEHKFREEISFDTYDNGEIGYYYSWGMPGGEFKDRSGLRLKRVN